MAAGAAHRSVGRRRGMASIGFGLAVLPVLSGCDVLSSGSDVFEGLTNPLVLQGLVLSIDAPPAPVDLAAAGLLEGASATVFLADAAQASELARVPVRGAAVRLTGPSIGTVPTSEVAPGAYVATSFDGLAYVEGERLEVTVTVGADDSRAGLELPTAPVLSLPAAHPAGTDLVIDLTGQGFDATLVAVFGPTGLTYSNVPDDIEELFAFMRSAPNPVLRVPGSTLTQPGGHAVGVAGLVNAGAADLDNMNTALSNLGAGKMAFALITVQ